MPVFSHPKKDIVEHRIAQFLRGGFRPRMRLIFTANTVDAFSRYLQRLNQVLPHQTIIAIRMIWRNTAFIGKEEFEPARRRRSQRMRCDLLEKFHGDSSAGKRAELRNGGKIAQPIIRNGPRQFGVTLKSNYLDGAHSTSSPHAASSSASRSRGKPTTLLNEPEISSTIISP